MISYFLYFLFAGLSILGVSISGYLIKKKTGKSNQFKIPSIIIMWCFFYLLAISVELLGHYIGLWTWLRDYHVFLHAGYWWATLLTCSILSLSTLNPHVRYFILLGWVLLYELIQEAFIGWVTHYPLLGSPYLMITVVMCVVCLMSYTTLELLKKMKIVKGCIK